jgi:hypothetical protein
MCYSFTQDLRVILLWKSFVYRWIDFSCLKEHYNSKQSEYKRLISGYNDFLKKSCLIDYKWPKIGEFLKSEDVNKEKKLQIYSEYLFASTEMDYRRNPLIPIRDHDAKIKIQNKTAVFKQELRCLTRKKTAKITKKMNPVQLNLHKSSVSLEIDNYENKTFTFFNNRYNSCVAEYIHELETERRPINQLEPDVSFHDDDDANQTTELLYKLVLSESQRQPSSVPSDRSSHPVTPSLQNIGPPNISSTPHIQCIHKYRFINIRFWFFQELETNPEIHSSSNFSCFCPFFQKLVKIMSIDLALG